MQNPKKDEFLSLPGKKFMKDKRSPNGQKIKLQILGIIRDTIRKSQWSQMTAAKIIGVDQPKVSQIINGKTTGFSLERLLIFLLRLHCTVELSVEVSSQPDDDGASALTINDLDAINFVVVSKDS